MLQAADTGVILRTFALSQGKLMEIDAVLVVRNVLEILVMWRGWWWGLRRRRLCRRWRWRRLVLRLQNRDC